jgi:uncharacterized Ntn-hydrolase superfamily protein
MTLTRGEDFPDLNIRVDDHPDSLLELRRLLGLWRPHWASRKKLLPTKADPSGSTDLDAIEAGWIAQGLDIRCTR